MAAKDKGCGNNLVALKDLDLGALSTGHRGLWSGGHINCTDQKWIGAPDPTEDLTNRWGFDTCSDPVAQWTIGAAEPWNRYHPRGWYLMPFHWYQVIAYVVRRRSSRRGGFYPGFHRRFSHTHARLPAKQIARSKRS